MLAQYRGVEIQASRQIPRIFPRSSAKLGCPAIRNKAAIANHLNLSMVFSFLFSGNPRQRIGVIRLAQAWWTKRVGLNRWSRSAEVGELTQADAGFGKRSV
jgi:hypothetical protein